VKDAAFSQFPRRHRNVAYMGYAVRTDRHRYVEWIDRRTAETAAVELYDEVADPGEDENVAGEPERQEVLERLRARLWKGFKRPAPAGGSGQ
jgi:iduronate 2-sulfatase